VKPVGWLPWALGACLVVGLLVIPFVSYRYEYTRGKRLREVVPGVFYRSGQMTVPGFEDAVARYHIRTIVNLQDEFPDPDLDGNYCGTFDEKETELCRRLGVQYVYLPPDLIPRDEVPERRPAAIDRFLAVMDDPANYPVLIHCRAGLHRTGCLAAVYRMEYQGWSAADALRDLKANGFGRFPATSANDYIVQYVLAYRPRGQKSEDRSQGSEVRDQKSDVRNERPETSRLAPTSDF
jgi:tyrosine-protein phosphatase SIW14